MARAKGATSLHVVGNRRAGAFYEALGFEFVGEVETRFETALSMRLEVRVSSDEVAIRRAGVGDYQSIADVWLESARTILRETPPSPGQLRQRIEDETAAGWDLFVATKADRIIAMLAIKRKAAILDQLFVHPVEHRRGIGRMLLRHAQRIMPGGFTLRTASSNARARGFYERMGLTLAEEALHPTLGTPVCYYRWAPPTAS
jgi:ribosomal protein S18 acetylase RimI-like enzyme